MGQLKRKLHIWAAAVLAFFLYSLLSPFPSYAAAGLDLKCKGAVLVEAQSGKVLYEKNSHLKWYPASMTKIMTLVLALEAVRDGRASLNEKVVASENACSYGGTQVWLKPGEEFSLKEMLIAIAVGSANDCCVAVAEHLAGTEEAFVDMMNKRAEELGAKNTHFANSHGLHNDNHYTTPYDLALISRYAITLPHMLELTSIKEYTFREKPKLVLYNTNKLLWWFEGTKGLKTGTTDKALRNLTAVAERNDLTLISVVMGCEEDRGHFTESMKLLRYGFARYTYKHFYSKGKQIAQAKVGKGNVDKIGVVPKENIGVAVPKGENISIKVRCELPKLVDAPVKKGEVIGNAVVLEGDKKVFSVPLCAAEEIKRASFFNMFKKVFFSIFSM
ncbi:MAG TPA: D-alanyl-D-alanine carboxypeptidase [Peptococcaceae bacterium]|nr:MAG: Serine-type D-Ala-D-Ala carboxypeptidase [Clostridia bacterium 41_269]HBT20472.1 D-alanyl-D-alanine carboxypeptidase [Peptococcaceae bacterium]